MLRHNIRGLCHRLHKCYGSVGREGWSYSPRLWISKSIHRTSNLSESSAPACSCYLCIGFFILSSKKDTYIYNNLILRKAPWQLNSRPMKIRFCHDLRKRSERNNVAVRFRDRNDYRIERQKTNLSFKGGVKLHLKSNMLYFFKAPWWDGITSWWHWSRKHRAWISQAHL